jgi:hypothetical protein
VVKLTLSALRLKSPLRDSGFPEVARGPRPISVGAEMFVALQSSLACSLTSVTVTKFSKKEGVGWF